jgi:transcription initiation factor IIE alpha subunit
MVFRNPKKWASQKIFFDVVVVGERGSELSRYAAFICRKCRYICDWEEDSLAFRCSKCGKKLTLFGAEEIIAKYESQFVRLKKLINEKKGK